MTDFGYYLSNGLLKKQHANFKQIEGQISRAEKDLVTLSAVLDKDPEWAASIAYQAMLRAGRALVFSHGYLPADGRQHKTVVEITGKLLGKEFDVLVNLFEKLRKKRNTFFYDSLDTGNHAEAKMAAATAKQLIEVIKEKVAGKDPQIKASL